LGLVVVAERRLELLKLECLGLSQSEIVKQVSEKFQVSARSVYRDFQLRSQWQPALLQLKDKDRVLQKIVNRYEQVYERAAFKHVTSPNEAVQVGALKIMLEATAKLAETLVLPEIMGKLDELEEHAKKVKLVE
jgi:FlaA1/EpsC-like NDP-sugar epimerase